MEIFELKPEHITLLQHMYVDWQDCETGAPEIDPKRPYGNSDVVRDIAEIFGEDVPEDYREYDGWRDTRGNELMELHYETHRALQVVLAFKSFEPGKFSRPNSWSKWQRVD